MDLYTSLKNMEKDTDNILKFIPGGIHECLADDNYTLVSMSDSFLNLFGYTSRLEIEEKYQNYYARMIHPDDLESVKKRIDRELLQGDIVELEYRAARKDGQALWILDKCRLVEKQDGTRVFYSILMDMTRQRQEKEELRLSLERHQVIMDQAADIIFEWDIKKDTLTFSPNWKKKFGYEPISDKIRTRMPKSKNINPDDMVSFIKLMHETAEGVPYSETEFRIKDIYGMDIPCRIRSTTQYNYNNEPVKAVGVITDISRERQESLRLLEKAQTDSLTGLANRNFARQRIESYLDMELKGILFLIDLDDFKQVNDRYGHLCGDALLFDASRELKRLCREKDVVARIGGDEFMIFLPGMTEQEAYTRSGELLSALKKLQVDSKPGIVSCSIGGAGFPEHGRDYYSLYKCADQALYYAKKQGKGVFSFFCADSSVEEPENSITNSCVTTKIDSDNGVANTILGRYCFELLYESADIRKSIKKILELLGKRFEVSSVYIFEEGEDKTYCTNTFQWCSASAGPEENSGKILIYGEGEQDFRRHFDENGILYCNDIERMEPLLRDHLKKQGIKSLLQCMIWDGNEFKGLIGFDEYSRSRIWTKDQIDALLLVSKVIATFLIKQNLKDKLSDLGSGL